MKTTEQIYEEYTQLNEELKKALGNFELSGKVRDIRRLIKNNQAICSHFSSILNFEITNKCPYCGKEILDISNK